VVLDRREPSEQPERLRRQDLQARPGPQELLALEPQAPLALGPLELPASEPQAPLALALREPRAPEQLERAPQPDRV